MSVATEINVLRAESVETKKALADLQRALDSFFATFPREQHAAWKRAKSGETETFTDVTAGRNLPAPVVKTTLNNIGGATI